VLNIANRPLTTADFPDFAAENTEVQKELSLVAQYNNDHKGIIDTEFLQWALDHSISYRVVRWFVHDFSGVDDENILFFLDGVFNHYTMYYDESNNCLKFKFKDADGDLNVDYTEDYVLAGVAFEGTESPMDINAVFSKLHLQKSVTDVKLKHLIGKVPEGAHKFLHALDSAKVESVLTDILSVDNLYIHWSAINLLYYSLVDIVDSVLSVPVYHNEIKNVLFKYAKRDEEYILPLLAQYKYPNIDPSKIKDYCFAMVDWIENIVPDDVKDEFLLEFLRQELKASGKKGDVPFLVDNEDHVLIDGFAADYRSRMGIFQGSTHIFDEISEVQEVLESTPIDGEFLFNRATFRFEKSHDSKWLQLCDIVAGIMASFFTFANRVTVEKVVPMIGTLNEQQKRNLSLLHRLMKKSTDKNMFFAQKSNVFSQTEVCSLIEKVGEYFAKAHDEED